MLVEIAIELCKGCELCVKLCRRGALKPGRDPNEMGYIPPIIDEELCNACGLCELYCPDLAITVSKLEVEGEG
jgi:2-oxoglutarate ferredoxin oxidoreductase subunit delta